MTPQMLAEKVNVLFSLPDIVLQINDLMEQEETTNADLEEVIQHDPALVAKLLKIVNSAYFSFPAKIDSISRAIALIGRQELRNMVFASAVANTFRGIPEHLVDMNTFWFHSVTSGAIARILAKKCHRHNRERFFIAGLLRSIGKLILFMEYPQKSKLILSLKEHGQEAMTMMEQETFGFTYAQLGAELLKRWRLPETIWSLIEHQLDPMNAKDSVGDVCILHVAMTISDALEPCSKRESDLIEPALDCHAPPFEYLNLQEQDVNFLIQEASMQSMEILSLIRPEAAVIF